VCVRTIHGTVKFVDFWVALMCDGARTCRCDAGYDWIWYVSYVDCSDTWIHCGALIAKVGHNKISSGIRCLRNVASLVLRRMGVDALGYLVQIVLL
jgi:hypothetical protein